MAEPRKLSPKEFRTMQLLELDMLEELDGYVENMILNTVLPIPVEKRQPHAPVSSFDFNVKSKNVKEKMQNNK